MPNWEGGSGTGYEGGPSTGRNNSGGTGNQNRGRDPLFGWDVYDRAGLGLAGGAFLGPAGSILGSVLLAATSIADPGGSVEAPFGSVSGGAQTGVVPPSGTGTGSETSRQIATALAAPIAPSLAPAPVAPIAPSLGPSIGTADIKRKRIGRQETILTSRSSLSDTSTARPTLLGQ